MQATQDPIITKSEAGEDGIRRETVFITEKNTSGQAMREVEVERITEDGIIRQTTVREVEYDTDTGMAQFEAWRAVDPERATVYVEDCYERGLLSRPHGRS